jgi:hypothetical protein
MSKFIDGLRAIGHELLSPGFASRQTEANYLRQRYSNDSAAVPRQNQWYRLVSPRGDVVGAEYSCVCGVSYPFLSLNDLFREYDCPTCKNHFSLLKAIGYTAEMTPANLPALLTTLPVRPRLAGKSESRQIDTGDADKSDVVSYEPYDYKGV